MTTSPKLSTATLKDGYFELENNRYQCLYCEASFFKEEVYPIDDHFFTSTHAIAHHVRVTHGGALKSLLGLSSQISGLSDTQKRLIGLMSLDLTDDEIAEQLEISTSTVRNHRFKLKEKKRHAQYLLAAIEMLEQVNDKMTSEEVSILNYDNRFDISQKERTKVLANFLDDNGRAKNIPSKEKSKIILLQYLAESFSSEKVYSEKEVNQIIQTKFDDFASIRRYLIQYGLLARTHSGEKYWKL